MRFRANEAGEVEAVPPPTPRLFQPGSYEAAVVDHFRAHHQMILKMLERPLWGEAPSGYDGDGPKVGECMPLDLDPSNTWWWLPWEPVDRDDMECDC